MTREEFQKDIEISIDNAMNHGLDVWLMIGTLQYMQMALVRSMQDVTRQDNDAAPPG